QLDSATGWSDVTLHGAVIPKSLDMHSVSGDCTVNVLDASGIDAKVVSRTGNVTLPETFTHKVPGHYQGLVGAEPCSSVSVVTVSGDVVLNVPGASDVQ
ncbi:MAG: hypothetical protein ACKO14_12480, partial [Armatimonadota bacterium]